MILDMPLERFHTLMRTDDHELTPAEISAGWHFCPDWDGLLVGSGMLERAACTCKLIPKVWVYTFAWNEAAMMPFFLRHYSVFADRIIVFDEHSTDGTREMLESHPLVEIRDWDKGMNDMLFLDTIHHTYREARGQADWIMWPDVDEFLYTPDLLSELRGPHSILGSHGLALIKTADHPTVVDDGKSQIYDLVKTGFRQENEDKYITWKPEIEVQFKVGRHELHGCNVPAEHRPFKLLHAHFVNGYEAAQVRNQRNIERSTAAGHPGAGWSYMPGATGPSSNEWLAHACANLAPVV